MRKRPTPLSILIAAAGAAVPAAALAHTAAPEAKPVVDQGVYQKGSFALKNSLLSLTRFDDPVQSNASDTVGRKGKKNKKNDGNSTSEATWQLCDACSSFRLDTRVDPAEIKFLLSFRSALPYKMSGLQLEAVDRPIRGLAHVQVHIPLELTVGDGLQTNSTYYGIANRSAVCYGWRGVPLRIVNVFLLFTPPKGPPTELYLQKYSFPCGVIPRDGTVRFGRPSN